jgi:hypothetical protein
MAAASPGRPLVPVWPGAAAANRPQYGPGRGRGHESLSR